MAIGFDILAF